MGAVMKKLLLTTVLLAICLSHPGVQAADINWKYAEISYDAMLALGAEFKGLSVGATYEAIPNVYVGAKYASSSVPGETHTSRGLNIGYRHSLRPGTDIYAQIDHVTLGGTLYVVLGPRISITTGTRIMVSDKLELGGSASAGNANTAYSKSINSTHSMLRMYAAYLFTPSVAVTITCLKDTVSTGYGAGVRLFF